MCKAQSFIFKLAETELEKELFYPMKVLSNGTNFLEFKNHCFDFLPAFTKAVQQIETHLPPHTLCCQGSGNNSTVGAITQRL